MKPRFSIPRQRGAGLIEPLVAIAILSVGILGIAQFQFGMVAQGTDAQARLVAAGFADELAAQMRVDAANAACYTLPQDGLCASPLAAQQAEDWETRAGAALPGFLDATATLEPNSQFVVTLRWTSKAFVEPRQLEVRTDVRQ